MFPSCHKLCFKLPLIIPDSKMSDFLLHPEEIGQNFQQEISFFALSFAADKILDYGIKSLVFILCDENNSSSFFLHLH